jgi:hypothetical protein
MILSILKYNNEVLKYLFVVLLMFIVFFFGVVDYPCGVNLTTLYLLLKFCNVGDVHIDSPFVGNIPVQNSTGNLIIYYIRFYISTALIFHSTYYHVSW